jgi:Ca2+-binding RTX toxin-like protein
MWETTMDRIYTRRAGTSANDTINGDGSDDLMYGYAGNDTLNGNGGNDRLLGGDGDDTLNGGSGRDVMFGEAGNDRMVGGRGGDTMAGGVGADTFVFFTGQQSGSAAEGRDVITDFHAGVDKIEFSGLGVEKMSDLTMTSVIDYSGGATWGNYYVDTIIGWTNSAGEHESMTVEGVSPFQLGEGSFLFT